MGVSIAFCGATTLMHEYYSVSPWIGVAGCVWQGENMRRRWFVSIARWISIQIQLELRIKPDECLILFTIRCLDCQW